MKNKVRVSNLQVCMGLIATAIAYGHVVYTGLVFQAVGRDAWFCVFLGLGIGSCILFVHQKLAAAFEGQSLVQYSKVVFGKWIGSLISCVYLLFFILVAALTIQELSLFMGLIYPQTPFQVFLVFEFLLVAWVVRAGGEVVTRVIQLLLPGLIFIGLMASIFSLKDKDPSKLLPLFDHTVMNFTHGILIYVVMICDLIVFGMFYSDVTNARKLPKNGLLTMGILVIMFLGPATGPIMVFGQKLASALPYPTYSEIQYIQITGVLERMDIAGVLLWTMGGYIRASVFVLGAARGVAHLFNEQRETLYVLPVVVLVAGVSLSVVSLSREELHQFLYTSYPLLALLVGVGLPLLTAIIGFAKNRGWLGKKSTVNTRGSNRRQSTPQGAP